MKKIYLKLDITNKEFNGDIVTEIINPLKKYLSNYNSEILYYNTVDYNKREYLLLEIEMNDDKITFDALSDILLIYKITAKNTSVSDFYICKKNNVLDKKLISEFFYFKGIIYPSQRYDIFNEWFKI